jgi:peptidoglycan-associated lipoprotein
VKATLHLSSSHVSCYKALCKRNGFLQAKRRIISRAIYQAPIVPLFIVSSREHLLYMVALRRSECDYSGVKVHSETIMKTFTHSLFLSATLSLAFFSSGCSWFSSGSGDAEDGGLSEADLAAQREGRFGSGNIPTAEGSGMFRDIHFGFDSYAIDGAARNDLEANSRTLSEQGDLRVVLEGHCDERGTAEYNMALGAERARAVKSALVALGIPSSRIETISYGEEIPLDPSGSEEAHARNRRVHFGVAGNKASKKGESRY